MGAAEIAARLSRHRNMAHTWLALYPAFPPPVVRLTIGHVWSWADIEAWAVETGRCAAVEPAPAVLAAGRSVDAADLVSSSDIAERLGRSRDAVNRWRRQQSFPEPVVTLEIGPVWTWTDVETWRDETERLKRLKRLVQDSSRLEQLRPTPPGARRLFVQLVRLDGIRFGSGRCVPPGAEPVAWTLRSLTGNPEPMPAALCAALDLPPGATYTDGVRRWMADHRLAPQHLGSHSHTGRQPGRPVVRPPATSPAKRDGTSRRSTRC